MTFCFFEGLKIQLLNQTQQKFLQERGTPLNAIQAFQYTPFTYKNFHKFPDLLLEFCRDLP